MNSPKPIESEFGFTFETEQILLFFGKKQASLEKINSLFSNISFQRIKQTHSDVAVEGSDVIHEADAHFTAKKNKGLIILTADCLPVLVYCQQTNRVAAIHAGWKGVANQIVRKTLQQLIQTGSTEKNFSVWIGPHIQQNSFEVESDVLEQLKNASYEIGLPDYSFTKNNKYFVDLNKIVISQINSLTNTKISLYELTQDTKTNEDFWSFRRDKEKAGRNFSFIALK